MSERNNTVVLLYDILESGQKIQNYTVGLTFETFSSSEMVVDAVIRNFEIIGEAANRLTDEFKAQHPQIDWYKIRGFRNRIVHDYAGIDIEIVWQIKEFFLQKMLQEIQALIANIE